MAPVIDVHTHNYTEGWLKLIRARGRPDYEIRDVKELLTIVASQNGGGAGAPHG